MLSNEYAISSLGWDDEREEELRRAFNGMMPARVSAVHRGAYSLFTVGGELTGKITGRLLHQSLPSDLPAVGDWVAIEARPVEGTASIYGVLDRRTSLSRKVAGRTTQEQMLAANIDVVFIVAALDEDFNPRRIERYLTIVWESGAAPVVVLNKSDLCEDVPGAVRETSISAPGVDAIAMSALRGDLQEFRSFIGPGRTCAFVGSSGVGKSTLINSIVGAQAMTVREIREDGKGRHTTTRRQLIPLAGGGALIDTPGMRELQLWDADEGIEASFADIMALAEDCRFSDCSHTHEPGCAVKDALEEGSLDEGRWRSYRKQQAELMSLARRKDKRLAQESARRWKLLTKEAKARARPR
ncbi:MAG: ribosome small subunit-dependent GTPase A [Actinomycetota bacterium]